MTPPPVMLDYQTAPPPWWRRYVRLALKIGALSLLLTALGWLTLFTVQAARRYQSMKDRERAHAALANYTMPPGTVLLDPTGGSAVSSAASASPKKWPMRKRPIPHDPVVEKNLSVLMQISSFDALPFVGDRMTTQGTAFVHAGLQSSDGTGDPAAMYLSVFETHYTAGSFPSYRFSLGILSSRLRLLPTDGETLPVVLAATPDANSSSWTLHLRLNGKAEWLRVDHSTNPPTFTASFGTLSTGRRIVLRY